MTSQGQHLFPQLFQDPAWVLVEPVLEPVTQSWLEVADANPTELKRKHQVKDDTQGFNID